MVANGNRIKILLVKLKLIGDALLLSGTARAIRNAFPEAEIHVVVRKGTEGILAGCPDIKTVYVTGDRSGGIIQRLRRFCALLGQLRAQKFDYAFEIGDGDRGRILAVCSGAKHIFANSLAFQSVIWKWLMRGAAPLERNGIHAARWDLDAVALAFPALASAEPPPPVFEVAAADFSWVDALGLPAGAQPVFVHPVASRPGKMWTKEGWVAVVRHLLASGRPVILSSGPSAAEVALCQSIADGAGGQNVFLTQGKLSWSAVAGALYRSCLYLGADTAAMHLATACGRPLVVLFAHPPESQLANWGPLSKQAKILITASDKIPMSAITPAEVIAAIDSLEAQTGIAPTPQE